MRQHLGNGFYDHGVATPISNHRGTVATVDGDGRNVVLVWLFDHRGGYALLMIDAETGESAEFAMPFAPGGDCPFAAILSSRNRFYTHFNSHFVEFDPARRAFTFHHATAPQMAMGMTEDDAGRIWSVTYPQSGVVSYDPANGEFTDYGHVYRQNWAQYQRSVAADDAGWLYFAVGNTASQIIALDPAVGEARAILDPAQRALGMAEVYRDLNGKVYGLAVRGGPENWYELHRGEARPIGPMAQRRPKPVIAGSQGLFHREFPDGRRLGRCDLAERILTVEDPQTGRVRQVRFDYTSEGARLMGVMAAPDGTLCGGTMFPMYCFSYDPRTDAWARRPSHGQWNTLARQGDRVFVGAYTHGLLLEWDPSRPWAATQEGQADRNPQLLTECEPTINRPHALLAHPDGTMVILAGTPGYGYTGGGLLFWDRRTGARTLLEHTAILPEHSTMSLLPLPDGKLLGGTTTGAGTGGEKKADQAELYIMDIATKRIEWHAAVLSGANEYTDLCQGPGGVVYGIADMGRFFVFDPAGRKVLREEDVAPRLGQSSHQQGPRALLRGDDETVYLLLARGIARVDPGTFEITMLAESPIPVGPGGDVHEGRIYFASESHLCSYELPDPRHCSARSGAD